VPIQVRVARPSLPWKRPSLPVTQTLEGVGRSRPRRSVGGHRAAVGRVGAGLHVGLLGVRLHAVQETSVTAADGGSSPLLASASETTRRTVRQRAASDVQQALGRERVRDGDRAREVGLAGCRRLESRRAVSVRFQRAMAVGTRRSSFFGEAHTPVTSTCRTHVAAAAKSTSFCTTPLSALRTVVKLHDVGGMRARPR